MNSVSISAHEEDGLWRIAVGNHVIVASTEQCKQLAAGIFAAVWLGPIDDSDMTLGEQMSCVLDAMAQMIGMVDDDRDIPEDTHGYISGSMGSTDA